MLHANNISFFIKFYSDYPVFCSTFQLSIRPITDHRPEIEKEYENSITKIIYSMFSYMKYSIHDFLKERRFYRNLFEAVDEMNLNTPN